ncbi:MAG: DUF4921 family protein [Planctomycetota bacterium]|nr:MAG: DUF4921 family protein [Planctomycetota bacterium]
MRLESALQLEVRHGPGGQPHRWTGRHRGRCDARIDRCRNRDWIPHGRVFTAGLGTSDGAGDRRLYPPEIGMGPNRVAGHAGRLVVGTQRSAIPSGLRRYASPARSRPVAIHRIIANTMGDAPNPTSSEMRYDWLADRWVIMAPNRTRRPDDFRRLPPPAVDPSQCPFCAGREAETPPEIAVYPAPQGKGGWQVRVVPNKFPAVQANSDTWPVTGNSAPTWIPRDIDLYQRRELTGGHEVIIESPQHFTSLSQLEQGAVATVFHAFRDRLYHWLEQQRIAYAVVFKNSGLDAGASLAHVHSQLIATDTVPADVLRIDQRMQLFLQTESECVLCRMAASEIEQGVRLVEQTARLVAFCPFASRLPGSITVLPLEHSSGFELADDATIEELALLMYRLIRQLELCYPDAAYNFVIHTAHTGTRNSPAFHWRIEMFPRLTKVAGFEWGSECYINPVLPETAAERLRQAGHIIAEQDDRAHHTSNR